MYAKITLYRDLFIYKILRRANIFRTRFTDSNNNKANKLRRHNKCKFKWIQRSTAGMQ